MQDRPSRFWDAFWVVAPLVIGGAIGIFLASQITSYSMDCDVQPSNLPAANYVLGVAFVVLLVGRFVARSVVGPVAARAFTIAALALLVSACGTYFATVNEVPCPPSGLASGHEAMVRTAPAQLHVS